MRNLIRDRIPCSRKSPTDMRYNKTTQGFSIGGAKISRKFKQNQIIKKQKLFTCFYLLPHGRFMVR